MKKPKIYSIGHDIVEWFEVEGLTQREVREAYSEMIDALVEVIKQIESDPYTTPDLEKSEQALKKAGCTECS